MKTIRKRWMWRRVMEKDLQDIPPGYPLEIFCLTKRSNPKSISWHFQSKQWTHSLKHTHTHTFMYLFLEPSQHFSPLWRSGRPVPWYEWAGAENLRCMYSEREQQHNQKRLNTLVVTEQQVYQRNNMFTCKAAPQTAFSNVLITFTRFQIESLLLNNPFILCLIYN